ncbi:MAG: rod shape-determining protein MreC [Vicinamibacterales bacterium]|nr:rod shape-determining protein MreC [Vicinamibacterales bacterium]
MALADIRQRTAVLFIAVMLGHIILISAQVNSRSGVPLLEVVTFGVFAEIQRGAAGMTGSIRNAWSGYVDLRGVRAENARLRQELGEIQVRFQQEHESAERTRQLERLLGFQHQIGIDTVPTNVIGAGASPDSRTVTIDRGTSSGVRLNMAVIAPTGVVGRVVTPTAHASKVQLLVDRNAGAGALVVRSRAQGVVVGAGEELMRMNYVSGVADVKVGDVVVTSGIDGIYPRGFVIGTIESVDKGNGLYKVIHVRPTVDFSRLEEVLVVTSRPAQASAVEDPS